MTGSATTISPDRDYFISRSTRDAAFARWVGGLIEVQGETYIEQSEHFGHKDFMLARPLQGSGARRCRPQPRRLTAPPRGSLAKSPQPPRWPRWHV